MKTIFFALALIACCTALVPSEFRNLTTTEIDYNYHVQTLIPQGLQQVLSMDQLDHKFNTTDFIVDKINFVSQKESKKSYIYKINLDFINSAGEIAETQFIGAHNLKSRKFSVHSLEYKAKYPGTEIYEQEEFIPSPINGTHSLGIYKHLRNYINENFNETHIEDRLQGYLFSQNATMYNSTYLPQDAYNNTNNFTVYSYNNTNVNGTYNGTWGVYVANNGTNMTGSWMNTTHWGYNRVNETANNSSLSTNMTRNATYWGYNRLNETANNSSLTRNMTYLGNETALNSTNNITEYVYNTLNILVDKFNSTNTTNLVKDLGHLEGDLTRIFEEIEVELEPLFEELVDFAAKKIETLDLEGLVTSLLGTGVKSMGLDLEGIMTNLLDNKDVQKMAKEFLNGLIA